MQLGLHLGLGFLFVFVFVFGFDFDFYFESAPTKTHIGYNVFAFTRANSVALKDGNQNPNVQLANQTSRNNGIDGFPANCVVGLATRCLPIEIRRLVRICLVWFGLVRICLVRFGSVRFVWVACKLQVASCNDGALWMATMELANAQARATRFVSSNPISGCWRHCASCRLPKQTKSLPHFVLELHL